MSDPAVCCFITKTLCAHGGLLGLPELQQHIGLSRQQLEETLSAAGTQRFVVLRNSGGDGARVLAVSAVRVCARKECGGCDRLHLCKLHLMGKCNQGARSCKYSHDIINENRKVLKTHGLSGLDEKELRVLLLQNDPFLLPDVCQLYNRKDSHCNLQNNCNKLHICRHFLHGECKFLPCRRSHDLLGIHALRVLEAGGIDRNIASNIQSISDHKHVEFNKELKKERIHNYKPREKFLKNPAVTCKDQRKQAVGCTVHVPLSEGFFIPSSHGDPSSGVPGRSQHQLPAGAGGNDKGTGAGGKHEDTGAGVNDKDRGAGGKHEDTGAGVNDKDRGAGGKHEDTEAGGKGKDKKDNSSANASKDNEEKCDDICLFYLWKYCKQKDKCRSVHYHLPYRWQVYKGITWNDLPMMEEIEKAYCDPKNNSMADKNIDFQAMTCCSSVLRRLSTPSSVTKPTFVLTTQWIWYWKNDLGQWTEYGEPGEGNSLSSPSSADIENLYLADPDATVSFQAGLQRYQLNFKEMTQTNIAFKTKRRVCRRPKFVSSEDVQKIKKGQRDSSIPNQPCPVHWDPSALPEFGYKAVEISSTTPEYNEIKQLFHQTMKNYKVLKIQRIQNPSLWKVFQWQKEQMKRENGGKEVNEKLLFHGTSSSFVEAICIHNLDWRICGSNGTNYGKGSYFARDASYSHAYCQRAVKTNTMFVARVLVGDYVRGSATYVRPPTKSVDGLRFYDSCVDDKLNPSIFVVFEKNQIYPEYIIEYTAEAAKCVVS